MNITELANEYEKQYNIVSAKAESLKPLLSVYSGTQLDLLRKKIKVYYEMACECKRISFLLSGYYGEDGTDEIL